MAGEESKWRRTCDRKKRGHKKCHKGNLGLQKCEQEGKCEQWATESALPCLLQLSENTHLLKYPGLTISEVNANIRGKWPRKNSVLWYLVDPSYSQHREKEPHCLTASISEKLLHQGTLRIPGTIVFQGSLERAPLDVHLWQEWVSKPHFFLCF